ncbi:aspartate carbamoyltransferase [Seinonella peptonophila]|uniref:Aspartate carbamoyltransferase n=2 Tax=Seinonella peptonophila TaxID=112248 RepID=A0A1M4SW94_9BACL|nr:aspartate carbamoyltransferase [Seinonella peptonophila]
MEHVLSIDSFSTEDLLALFRLTDRIKHYPDRYREVLSSKVVATLFYEPSTRTRLSFEAAIQRLGGHVISTENARELSSAVKGENLRDTIRVVHGYADAIILRHYENEAADIAASVADVPIINAGSGSNEHPTQAMLDLYTIYSHKGRWNQLSYVLSGDLRYGRTVHSLVKKLSESPNVTIYGLSHPAFRLPEEYIALLHKNNIPYHACSRIEEIPSDIDVIYHTRTQLERMEDSDESVQEIIIDLQALNHFRAETILLHPLPRNREIATEVDQDPRALYFAQSKNGMYVRMALLTTLLGE